MSQKDWIDSLVGLGNKMYLANVPQKVLSKALDNNPWFTRYYIGRSLEGIRKWMEAEQLNNFVEKYDFIESPVDKKLIGIIAAGNVPFVGLHDLVCGILSGHKLSLKLSHQDQALMNWLIGEWMKLRPELEEHLFVGEISPDIDFLIATGSNNTARYFEATYEKTPKIIRKNRYSVAVIGPETTEEELGLLCEDMLLYNGLGCRNVSNLFLLNKAAFGRLQKKLEKYPVSKVNSNYLERILFESTRKGVIKQEYITSKFGLFSFGSKPKPVEMGYFQLIQVENKAAAEKALESLKAEIQVVVGNDVPFGSSQSPGIADFADGIDTMKILTESL